MELLARVRVLLRRGQPTPEICRRKSAQLFLDCIRRKVTRSGENVELAPARIQHSGIPCAQSGPPFEMHHDRRYRLGYGLRRPDQHRRRLYPSACSKIDDKRLEKMIQTVRGIGYMLDIPDKTGERAM